MVSGVDSPDGVIASRNLEGQTILRCKVALEGRKGKPSWIVLGSFGPSKEHSGSENGTRVFTCQVLGWKLQSIYFIVTDFPS